MKFFNTYLILFFIVTTNLIYSQQTSVAVLDIKAIGLSKDIASVLTDVLRSELFKHRKFIVMNREDMKDIMGEQSFQNSGVCDDNACYVEIGNILGVSKIITGSIGIIGSTYSLTVKQIDIDTSQNDKILSYRKKCEQDDLFTMIENAAKELSGIIVIKEKSPEPVKKRTQNVENIKTKPVEIKKKPIKKEDYPINIKQGLVAYYPFNGNAKDESVNSNDGIVNNAVLTENRFGNPNSAYYFDGRSSEINCGHNESINLTNQLTISIKFKIKSFPNVISPLIYKGWIRGGKQVYNGVERTYSLWVEKTGLVHLTSADSKGQQFVNTPSNIVKLNTWYHYIGIIDRENGVMESYLDGELVAQGKIRSSNAVESEKPLLIGSSIEKYSKFANFNGVIDDIKIYNRALNQQELKILFNE